MNKGVTAVSKQIQVCGGRCFEIDQWREAVSYYLDEVWSGDRGGLYSPKIAFGRVTLRLDDETGRYYAYGESSQQPHDASTSGWYQTGPDQAEVEAGLIRLLRNERIKGLTIQLTRSQCFYLWKEENGEYSVAAEGIPFENPEVLQNLGKLYYKDH